jgi:hypothetical protein
MISSLVACRPGLSPSSSHTSSHMQPGLERYQSFTHVFYPGQSRPSKTSHSFEPGAKALSSEYICAEWIDPSFGSTPLFF